MKYSTCFLVLASLSIPLQAYAGMETTPSVTNESKQIELKQAPNLEPQKSDGVKAQGSSESTSQGMEQNGSGNGNSSGSGEEDELNDHQFEDQ